MSSGYRQWPFQCGLQATPTGLVPRVSTRVTLTDRFGHWRMRWGIGRQHYRIAPGLYAIGTPDFNSPVLVTANYKMTFDLLRQALHDWSVWVVVLDTKGINVWCAAGKGTFGTQELLRQVAACRLDEVVGHRTLILPQLGAPGIAAHEVLRQCGFRVCYGPVRAIDLPGFLSAGGQATPAMRKVTFAARERLVLIPVEIVSLLRPIGWSLLVLPVLGGLGPGLFTIEAATTRGALAILAGLAGVMIGAVLVPLLLPWLPGRMFAIKGAVAGLVMTCAIVLSFVDRLSGLNITALLLCLPAVSAWCAMNFTGSTTFTSPSGVEYEMRRTIPWQAAALLSGGLCWIAGAFV